MEVTNTFIDINMGILEALDKLNQIEADQLEEGVKLDKICYPPELLEKVEDFFEIQIKKVDNVAKFDIGLTARIKAIKAEEDRLKNVRQNIGRAQERYRQYIKYNLQVLNQRECVGSIYSVKLRKSPPKLEVLMESEIPDEYFDTVISKKLDKKKTKEAIKSGESVPGCVVIQEEKVVIK